MSQVSQCDTCRTMTQEKGQTGPVGSMAGSAGILAGDIFRNRYGLLLRVMRVEKRGVVRVFGSHVSWDMHEGLTEWADLHNNWKPNK